MNEPKKIPASGSMTVIGGDFVTSAAHGGAGIYINPGDHDKERLRAALVLIRDHAATTENGGAWASGIAALCLSR